MKPRRLAPLLLVLAACQPAPVPTGLASNPPSEVVASASTQPESATPATRVPGPSAEAEIEDFLQFMSAFVLVGDGNNYLSLVDQSDPVFATEHRRWVADWAGPHPVVDFSRHVTDVEVEGRVATGLVSVTWSVEGGPPGEGPRTASFRAQFTHGGGGWRYAGEAWSSTEGEGFIVRVAPGLEPAGQAIAAELPAIYDQVTAAFGYEPAGTLEIKLYADPEALVANTLLSLPVISGWNEPGEALKLVDRPDGPPLGTIAHELTHFLGFDRAGTQRSRMPWWLDEGIATYIGSQVEGRPQDDRLAEVIAWEASGELADWTRMVLFEETPLELWPFVYSQGYVMVRFVTEEFGVERRNRWLAAMATELDIDEATESRLGRSFGVLDGEFRDWLRTQR